MHVLLEGSVHPPSNKDLLTLACAITALEQQTQVRLGPIRQRANSHLARARVRVRVYVCVRVHV